MPWAFMLEVVSWSYFCSDHLKLFWLSWVVCSVMVLILNLLLIQPPLVFPYPPFFFLNFAIPVIKSRALHILLKFLSSILSPPFTFILRYGLTELSSPGWPWIILYLSFKSCRLLPLCLLSSWDTGLWPRHLSSLSVKDWCYDPCGSSCLWGLKLFMQKV